MLSLTKTTTILASIVLTVQVSTAQERKLHNVILFVADGLRALSVTPDGAPTAGLRDKGINFKNSHSIFPTFTTANASAFATGHFLGDTGDFSNTIYAGFPVKAANDSTVGLSE